MREKFADADEWELAIANIHYKKMQFILNVANSHLDPRIDSFRRIFNNRVTRHKLCLSLKTGYKVLSKDVHDELILLANKTFSVAEIRDSLKKLLKFSDFQVENLCKFVEVVEHDPPRLDTPSSFLKVSVPTLKTSPQKIVTHSSKTTSTTTTTTSSVTKPSYSSVTPSRT